MEPLVSVGNRRTSKVSSTIPIPVLAASPIEAPRIVISPPITRPPTCARHMERDMNPDVLPRISSLEARITILGWSAPKVANASPCNTRRNIERMGIVDQENAMVTIARK